MSQAGIVDFIGTHPVIPTLFVCNVGSAVPIANTLEILGTAVAAHSVPLQTVGSGNTVSIDVQYASSAASSVANNAGVASFNSAQFTVDANGFVSFSGGAVTESFMVDAATAPGTNPVTPNGSGIVTVTGGQVAAGTTTNVIRTNSLAANTYTIQIQRSQAVASSTVGDNGVSHFNSTYFTVDSNGFVSVNGSGLGETITGNTGGALSPTAGNWNILGTSTAPGTTPVQTSGTGSTLTVQVQKSQAIASTNASNVGLAAFNSTYFTVDSNGFVSLVASSVGGIFTVDANTAPGTNPVVPNASGIITINGGQVAAGTTTNVIRTDSLAANTYTIQIQRSQAVASSTVGDNGVAHFNSSFFTVDSNGFVSLNGSGVGETITGNTGGALSPTSGNWNILGTSTAAGTTPVQTSGSGSTLTVQVQKSQAIASTNATNVGLAAFNSSQFTVDSNGFVSLVGSGAPIESVAVDANTAPGTNPVVPSSGQITVTGGQVAAGTTTNVIRTDSLAANTYTIQIQRSQAVASSTVGDNGVAHFNSTYFTVDSNGFVSVNGSGLGETITGDSGGALSPSSGNWNIFGLSGSKTSGSGSTLTIKSPPYADAGGSATSTLNSGSFVTGAFTLTLPVSAGLADGDIFEYVCTTSSAMIVQAVGSQKIRIGNQLSSAAGTATSSGTLAGDALTLRFRASDGFFYATSVIGIWTTA
jgi:fibronectin-binding autotransporter adhesin